VRRHRTSEAEVGAPFLPVLGFTSQCLPRAGATASRFMPSHGSTAVVRRFFRRVVPFTTGDWDAGRRAFTVSAGSTATCRTAPSGSRVVLPACSCPGGLSAAGQLVAQTLPSRGSRLNRGCDDAPHGAPRTGYFRIIRLSRCHVGYGAGALRRSASRVPHVPAPRPPASLRHWAPLPVWTAFPSSDDYGSSAAIGLSSLRPSRTSLLPYVQAWGRWPVRAVLRVHYPLPCPRWCG